MNSRLDFFNLWKRRVLGTLPDLAIMPTLNDEDDMSPEQIRTKTRLETRSKYNNAHDFN